MTDRTLTDAEIAAIQARAEAAGYYSDDRGLLSVDIDHLLAALTDALARAETAEWQLHELRHLDQIPAEEVAGFFIKNEASCQMRSESEIWDHFSHARLTEVIRRARIDGANASAADYSGDLPEKETDRG